MKKGLLLASICILLLGSIIVYNSYAPEVAGSVTIDPNAINIVSDNNIISNSKETKSIEAYYADYEFSLENVKNKADLIVVGKVVSQTPYGEVGIKNEIQVSKVIKGNASNTIYVLKAGFLEDPEYILQNNKEYILLLGDQSENGENSYFIKGGEQGCFLIVDGEVLAKDNIMKKDLKALTKEMKSQKEQKSLKDQIIEYLSK